MDDAGIVAGTGSVSGAGGVTGGVSGAGGITGGVSGAGGYGAGGSDGQDAERTAVQVTPDLRDLPGGVSNTTHGEGVRRGVGYAVGYKNVGFSEGFDDYSTARVRLEMPATSRVTVHTAAAEVGQGLLPSRRRSPGPSLGWNRVVIQPAGHHGGSAGSSSASRQTYVTGGAVRAACAGVRRPSSSRGSPPVRRAEPKTFTLSGGKVVSQSAGGQLADLAALLGDEGDRGDRGLAAPAHAADRPGHRPGQRPRPVRLRGAPCRGGRGHRARPGQGGGSHPTSPRMSGRR